MNDYLVIIALTTGLIEIVKRIKPLSFILEWLPLLALLTGLSFTLLSGGDLLTGIAVGLASQGLYDSSKWGIKTARGL